MTGPDRIWVNWKPADDEHPPSVVGAATVYSHINTMAYPVEYIRRDPAVIASLPEVQALIAAAYEVAAKVASRAGSLAHKRALRADKIGHDTVACIEGCVGDECITVAEEIRALTPAEAIPARAEEIEDEGK